MKKIILLISLALITSCLFFYQIFKGMIPFPGDLLVGQYAPYNSNSYFGIPPGGVPNKGQSFDTIRILFPWKEFAITSLAGGHIPLWNPYNFSGTPFLANFQGGTFYPLNILFLIFPILFAWTVYIFLQPVLIIIFTYLLLKELKLSSLSSFFGAVTFAFSSYVTVWLEYGNFGHALLWLPLILLLIEKNLKNPKKITTFLLILSLTLSILAGYIQITIYVFFFSFLFLIFRIISTRQKNPFHTALLYIPIFIFPALISATQLFPTIELFFNSARNIYSADTMSRLLIPPIHTITTFIPDFFGNPATRNYWLNGTYIERVSYIGVIPLFFFFYYFFIKEKNKTSLFFSAVAIFTYLISFQNPLSNFLYSFGIPIIGTGVPTRIMFVFCFSAAITASFGFEYWLKNYKKNFWLPSILFLILFSAFWLITIITPHFQADLASNLAISKRNLIIPTITFLAFAFMVNLLKKVAPKNILALFIIIITIADLFYFFQKITPFSPQNYFYPPTLVLQKLKQIQGINRSWGYGTGYMDTNFQTHEKIFSTDGYDPLFIKTYAELINSAEKGKLPPSIPRTDVIIPKGYGDNDLKQNNLRQQILNLTGVKYILSKDSPQSFPQDTYSLIWQSSPWQIFENKKSIPRIFLAKNYVIQPDKNKTIEAIFSQKYDLRNTVILQEPIPSDIKPSYDEKSALNLLEYESDKIKIKTNSQKDSLLFISDNYYPGWHAYVDNKKTKIYQADYSFRAVPIKKGNHTTTFKYYPSAFDTGWKISALSLILLLPLIFLLNKYLKK